MTSDIFCDSKLLSACQNKDIKTVQSVLSQDNVDVNCEHLVDSERMTPLLHAINNEDLGLVKLLLEHGASVSNFPDYTSAPLLHACMRGCMDIIEAILEKKPPITFPNKMEASMLYNVSRSASMRDNYNKILERLLNYAMSFDYADHSVENVQFFGLISNVIKNKLPDVKSCLRSISDIDFTVLTGEPSPLFYSILFERHGIAKLFLWKGARVDPDYAQHPLGVLHCGVVRSSLRMVSLLLEHRVNVNGNYDVIDSTHPRVRPIYITAAQDNLDFAKLLLDNGGEDLENYAADFDRSALYLAARNRSVSCFKLLLEHRAKSEKSGLGSPVVKAYMASALLQAIADYNFATALFLLEHGADVCARDPREKDPRIPFLQACGQTFEPKELKVFIGRCRDPSICDVDGQTALHYMARNPYALSSDILDFLLRRKIHDVNVQDSKGNTPLHETEKLTCSLLCQNYVTLLEHGADLSVKNHAGLTSELSTGREYEFRCICTGAVLSRPAAKCPVLLHYMKLRLIKYDFQTLPQCRLKYMFEIDEASRKRRGIHELFRECDTRVMADELEELKSLIIDGDLGMSLHKLMIDMDADVASTYLQKELVRGIRIGCDGDFKERFPYFGYLLNQKLCKQEK